MKVHDLLIALEGQMDKEVFVLKDSDLYVFEVDVDNSETVFLKIYKKDNED